MKYRSRTDIIGQILDTAIGGGGATKTKILYEACLSHNQLKEYLTVLIQSKAICLSMANKRRHLRLQKKVFSFLKPTIRLCI
jgi:predicted transcriptional regulator